ncbi:MAG: hypothetical protein AAGH15_09490 [Myxococcota bacterium]
MASPWSSNTFRNTYDRARNWLVPLGGLGTAAGAIAVASDGGARTERSGYAVAAVSGALAIISQIVASAKEDEEPNGFTRFQETVAALAFTRSAYDDLTRQAAATDSIIDRFRTLREESLPKLRTDLLAAQAPSRTTTENGDSGTPTPDEERRDLISLFRQVTAAYDEWREALSFLVAFGEGLRVTAERYACVQPWDGDDETIDSLTPYGENEPAHLVPYSEPCVSAGLPSEMVAQLERVIRQSRRLTQVGRELDTTLTNDRGRILALLTPRVDQLPTCVEDEDEDEDD